MSTFNMSRFIFNLCLSLSNKADLAKVLERTKMKKLKVSDEGRDYREILYVEVKTIIRFIFFYWDWKFLQKIELKNILLETVQK